MYPSNVHNLLKQVKVDKDFSELPENKEESATEIPNSATIGKHLTFKVGGFFNFPYIQSVTCIPLNP